MSTASKHENIIFRKSSENLQVSILISNTMPSEIPVEVNNKIVFAINLKVAQKLELTILPEVLYQADWIIR